jgi:hypothetical protein
MMNKHERGQVLVLFIGVIAVALAIISLAVDGGHYLYRWMKAQEDLDAACLAAFHVSYPDDPYSSFINSLEANNDELDIRNLEYTADGFRGSLSGGIPTYLISFMGISSLDVSVSTRCLGPDARSVPIAVKEPWLTGDEWPILGAEGHEDQCDTCQGSDFAGAVLPWYHCTTEECDERTVYAPAPSNPNSPNTAKDLFRDTMLGNLNTPLPTPSTRVPQISGVSNNFLVKAIKDGGFEVGDQILVMVFDGSIADTNPWENTEIMYYAIFTITEFTSNSMSAEYVERINDLEDAIARTRPRTIPYDWTGSG